MSVEVERLPNEPIIIATLSGDVSTALLQEMFAQCVKLMEGIDGRVYRIIDIRFIEINFPELVQVLARNSNGQPGSPSDPRLCGVLVGTRGWARFFAESLHQSQYRQLNIPIFEDFDDAMACLREQIVLDQALMGVG